MNIRALFKKKSKQTYAEKLATSFLTENSNHREHGGTGLTNIGEQHAVAAKHAAIVWYELSGKFVVIQDSALIGTHEPSGCCSVHSFEGDLSGFYEWFWLLKA